MLENLSRINCAIGTSNTRSTRWSNFANTEIVTYTYYSPVNGLSDAFIKAPSASGYNSTWSDNATKIEALGVNHLEMKDHAVMKEAYNRIFDGLSGAHTFFNAVRRN